MYYNSMVIFVIICMQSDVRESRVLVLPATKSVSSEMDPSWRLPFALLPSQDGLPSLVNVSQDPDANSLSLSDIAVKIAKAKTGLSGFQPVDDGHVAPADSIPGNTGLEHALAVIVVLKGVPDEAPDNKVELRWITEREVELADDVRFEALNCKGWMMHVLRSSRAVVLEKQHT